MTLMGLAEENLTVFESYNIQQIVAICGDGSFLDNSECSLQLRKFLTLQGSRKLAAYASHCLDNSFQKSGAVLQDVINEIGRRLGYHVTNGRYSGSQNEIGFDGLWSEGSSNLIVEVKTTDAYRINLDVVVNYAVRAKAAGLVTDEANILLIVGRQDTGDLEAQIRGSRHAWQVRLVSIDSLTKLMSVRQEIGEQKFVTKLRRILFPFQYTRVDQIIELVFETQRETEDKIIEVDKVDTSDDDTSGASKNTSNGTWVFTPSDEIDAKRESLLKAFFAKYGSSYRRVSRAQYMNDLNNVRVACSISKRYDRDYQPYWYAFHPTWLSFLQQGNDAFFILGCMDRSTGFAIPLETLQANLNKLNQTGEEPKHYWHVALGEDQDGLFLNMSKTGEKLYLGNFEFPV